MVVMYLPILLPAWPPIKISYTQVGPSLAAKIISIPYQPANGENGIIKGNIPVLDVQYGNVWTNIPLSLIQKAGIHYGDEVSSNHLKGEIT
jgi:S-adenosylmethionine hydrolase